MRSIINLRTLGIGLVAGLASALLLLSPMGGTTLAVPLTAAVALPLVIASLGWGTLAGLTAAGVAAVAAALVAPLLAADFLIFFAPAALVGSHLLGLARPRALADVPQTDMPAPPGSGLEWYPIGQMAAVVAVVAAVAALAVSMLVGFNPVELSAEQLDGLATTYAQMLNEGGNAPSADEIAAVRQQLPAMLAFLPFIFTAMWTLIALVNLYLGAWIAARSARLARPWEDVAGFEPPVWATGLFLGAIAVAMIGGSLGAIAAALAGALAMLHLLVGLGVVHTLTRGWALRIPLLITVYVLFGLFSLPLLVLGVIERFARLRARARLNALTPPNR